MSTPTLPAFELERSRRGWALGALPASGRRSLTAPYRRGTAIAAAGRETDGPASGPVESWPICGLIPTMTGSVRRADRGSRSLNSRFQRCRLALSSPAASWTTNPLRRAAWSATSPREPSRSVTQGIGACIALLQSDSGSGGVVLAALEVLMAFSEECLSRSPAAAARGIVVLTPCLSLWRTADSLFLLFWQGRRPSGPLASWQLAVPRVADVPPLAGTTLPEKALLEAHLALAAGEAYLQVRFWIKISSLVYACRGRWPMPLSPCAHLAQLKQAQGWHRTSTR